MVKDTTSRRTFISHGPFDAPRRCEAIPDGKAQSNLLELARQEVSCRLGGSIREDFEVTASRIYDAKAVAEFRTGLCLRERKPGKRCQYGDNDGWRRNDHLMPRPRADVLRLTLRERNPARIVLGLHVGRDARLDGRSATLRTRKRHEHRSVQRVR